MSQTLIIAPCKAGPCRRKIDSLGRSWRQGTQGEHLLSRVFWLKKEWYPAEGPVRKRTISIWKTLLSEEKFKKFHWDWDTCAENLKRQAPLGLGCSESTTLNVMERVDADRGDREPPPPPATEQVNPPPCEITEQTGKYWVWKHIKGNQSEVQKMEAGLNLSW